MNERLSMSEIATHVRGLVPGALRVGTSLDRDYLTAFGTTYPAVWVGAQRITPLDDGGGGSGAYHQRMKAEVALRIVVQRYADGSTDAEARLNTLHNAVLLAMRKYAPTGAWTQFVSGGSQDGPPHESVCYSDLIFSCSILYSERP